eukprot:gene3976-7920_t
MESLANFKHNIHFWEPINLKFWRACVAESIAMSFFVTLCCGAAMVTLNLPNPNLMMVAASFGFGIMVIAQFIGPLSGGHINCAVSFALFIGGRVSFIRFLFYTGFQMVGSIFGAFALWAIFGRNWPAARAFGSNSWSPEVYNGGQVFFAEMLGTMLLVFNVFSTIDIPKSGGGALGVYPIAMSVMVAHLFLLPIDGCSINPTRSFGPYFVSTWAGIPGTYQGQQYMFWVGPMIGAYASLKPENFNGAGDLQDAIWQANKKRDKEIAVTLKTKIEGINENLRRRQQDLTSLLPLGPKSHSSSSNNNSSSSPTTPNDEEQAQYRTWRETFVDIVKALCQNYKYSLSAFPMIVKVSSRTLPYLLDHMEHLSWDATINDEGW